MEAKDLAHFSDTSFLTNAQNMSFELTKFQDFLKLVFSGNV